MPNIIVPVDGDGHWTADLGAVATGSRPLRIRSRAGGTISQWRGGRLFVPPHFAREATWHFDFINRRAWIENVRGQGVAYDLAGLLAQLSFTRASAADYVDEDGVWRTAANDTLRFDHDPSTLEPLGVLIESSQTNQVPDNTATTATVGTIGSGGALPTGWALSTYGLTQQVVAKGTSGGIPYVDVRLFGTPNSTSAAGLNCDAGEVITPGQTWAVSGWLALVGGSLTNVSTILLRLNDESSATWANLTGELTRFVNVRTAMGTTARWRLRWNYTDTSTPVDFTVRVGLPQRELNAFASSPIRTTGTVASRAGDVLTAALGDWFNAAGGTIVVEWSLASLDAVNRRVLSLDTGVNSTRIGLNAQTSGGRSTAQVIVSSSTQANLDAGAALAGGPQRLAVAWASNDFAASLNGGTPAVDGSGSVPTGLTTLRLGALSSGERLNGHIRRVSYIPRRVSNAELQALAA